MHFDRDIGVKPDLHDERVGEGAECELGRRVGAVAGQRESGEDRAGKDDVLGGGTGLPGCLRSVAVPAAPCLRLPPAIELTRPSTGMWLWLNQPILFAMRRRDTRMKDKMAKV